MILIRESLERRIALDKSALLYIFYNSYLNQKAIDRNREPVSNPLGVDVLILSS